MVPTRSSMAAASLLLGFLPAAAPAQMTLFRPGLISTAQADELTRFLFAWDFCPDAAGGSDVYVTQREKGGWSAPVNLGRPVNSEVYDFGARVSPDGAWLFVTSNRPVPGWSGPHRQNIWKIRIAEVPALAFLR